MKKRMYLKWDNVWLFLGYENSTLKVVLGKRKSCVNLRCGKSFRFEEGLKAIEM